MSDRERGVEAAGDRAVAAGGDIGRVATGDYVTQVERAVLLPPEALAPAACPPGLSRIPRKGVRFVGRARELEWLDYHLGSPEDGVVVLLGLGGVGKSTLAAHWAARRAEGHRPAWWITAESRAELDAGLADLAGAMQPALIDVLPRAALCERALHWLSTHDGWLLVLDNVTEAADVEPLLSRVPGCGRILITTRQAAGWDGLAEVLALTVPDVDDSYAMFAQTVTGLGPRDVYDVRVLCARLGHLPLAVAQAAAYCAETRTSPAEYLDQLRQYPADLYETAPGDGRQAVAWTWRLTLDRLAAADPLTGVILRVLAWWGPDRIPRHLLDRLGPAPRVRRAVGRLAAHSMVTLHEDGAVSVHRLVQAVARMADGDDPHRRADDIEDARALAEEALTSALPHGVDSREEWRAWRELRPHVETYVAQADPATDTARTAALVHRGARFLVSDRDTWEAEDWYERAVACRERVLGADHPETAASRECLAECLGISGDLERSGELLARVVADLERVLGEDRVETHVARGKLAINRRHLGDKDGAVTLLEGALAGLERLLGPGDRETLLVRSNLGIAYQDAGRLDDAIALQETTLRERRSLLGPDHPDTLTSRLNLVRLYELVGEVERAVAEFDALVEDTLEALGEDHHFTGHLMHVSPPGGHRRPLGWFPSPFC
ncbi:tetratricopeptide repeat-containing protein [Streptomyces sp. NPDC047981]|uniref:tetratricopeptide repeat-containing protein n=1 Tax=Streptomyces sp. NPDC047981 TaxID=3154610 RepID=UPI00341C3656